MPPEKLPGKPTKRPEEPPIGPEVDLNLHPIETSDLELPRPDTLESINTKIAETEKMVQYEKDTHRELLGTAEEELKELQQQKQKLESKVRSPQVDINLNQSDSVVESAPTAPPAPEPAPSEPKSAESLEPKSFNEVLALQKEAFSARHEMMAIRHGKKVDDLTEEDRARYKELREISQTKRKVWLAELARLPAEQQGELKSITRLKDVEARFNKLSSDQIVSEAFKGASAETNKELEALDAEIKKFEGLVKFDKTIQPNVPSLYADRNIADLKELKARRRALLAKIKGLETDQPQPNVEQPVPAPAPEIPPTISPTAEASISSSEAEPAEPLNHERVQAESKSRRHELLRASMNEVDKRILTKTLEQDAFPSWNVMGKMRARHEIDALLAERRRLDRELNERVGFGAKFKEIASKAYRAVKSRLKFERSKPTVLGLSEAPEATAPTAEDMERVEREAHSEIAEPALESKGSTWQFIKQRLYGLGTGGYQEFKPAQEFRKGTKEVGRDVASFARLIQKERDLSYNDAEDEAIKIIAQMKAEGIKTSADPRFIELSTEITERKVSENDAKIDEIVLTAIDQLEKRLKEYKGDFGEDVLTEENKSKIATEMRARLVNLRSGRAEADAKELTSIIRGNLDENWWWRYVYGTMDAILAGLAIKWIGGKLLAGKAIAAKGAGAASKEVTTVLLKDTIWAEAERQLVAHGIANPTNGQILQVATKFCVDSGVKVMANGQLLWAQTAGGAAIDTALAKGFAIKMAGGLKMIAGMVVAP